MGRACLLLLLVAGVAAAEELPRMGVLDFQANGASPQLASALNGLAANEVQRLGVFKVITSQAVRDLLALERQKQLLGCSEDSCVSELAGALGVDYVLTGKVSRAEAHGGMPATLTLEMTLLHVAKARQEGSDVQVASSEAELMGRVGRGITKLLSKVLAGRSGFLVLSASEAGAVVRVDDTVVGTTPLAGRLTLPGGPHFVAVEKEGFVSFQRQVQVRPAELIEEQAVLVPSPDFVREYEARNGRMRLGAWLSTGLAVLGAGVVTWSQLEAGRVYGDAATPGSFAYHQARLVAGLETEEGVDHRLEAERRRAHIQELDRFTLAGVGVGGAAALAAAYLFIAGDDPGRYARYREPAAQVGLGLTPGGAAASVAVRF